MENAEIMTVEQSGQLSTNVFSDPEAFQNLFNIGKMFASSSLVPQAYQGKPMDCAIACDMANRMNVSPMFVMQNLYVVKGKPQWSGQACMSMIKASPLFKSVKPVYTGEKNTDRWGCYISAIRKEDGEEVHGVEVTIKMAKDEGWYSKKDKYGNACLSSIGFFRKGAYFQFSYGMLRRGRGRRYCKSACFRSSKSICRFQTSTDYERSIGGI